jgi:hypothetical protein
MAIEVEINLKIPRVVIRTANQPDQVIDNSSVRFITVVDVPAIPKPGTSMQLATSYSEPLECTVTRADWNEERSRFIISCSYAKRSISAAEYDALVNDAGWRTKPLL